VAQVEGIDAEGSDRCDCYSTEDPAGICLKQAIQRPRGRILVEFFTGHGDAQKQLYVEVLKSTFQPS
jgi:hypothetical protein